jgi:hypothetical protein
MMENALQAALRERLCRAWPQSLAAKLAAIMLDALPPAARSMPVSFIEADLDEITGPFIRVWPLIQATAINAAGQPRRERSRLVKTFSDGIRAEIRAQLPRHIAKQVARVTGEAVEHMIADIEAANRKASA